MSSCRLLLAWCFIAGCSLFADSLPSVDATFANADWGNRQQITFTLGGPSFTMGGSAFWIPPPIVVTPGESAHSSLPPFALAEVSGHHLIPTGTLTLAGVTYGVEYAGIAGVIFPDFIVPTTSTVVVVPSTLAGMYTACTGLLPGFSNACDRPGDQNIATINVNVPGELTLPFGFTNNGLFILGEVTFVSSPVPEASSASYAVLFFGAAAIAIAVHHRRRFYGKR